jgi:hypothetical protein
MLGERFGVITDEQRRAVVDAGCAVLRGTVQR